ncbi:MAG: hypothetical protein ORN85_08010 [Sediminibacterium sp.]|nr:hypothetical protein [Sediminibacterium sp.]
MSIDFKKLSAAAKAKTDKETQAELNQISSLSSTENELIQNLTKLTTDRSLIQQICTIVYNSSVDNLEKKRQLKALNLSVGIVEKIFSITKL